MIEDFEMALAKERARSLAPIIAAMSEVEPPKHLTVLRGTVRAFYDDGFELAMELEIHPHPKATVNPWIVFMWAMISLAFWAGVYLMVDAVSQRNGIASLKQAFAVFLIAAASFVCGRDWKR